MSETTQTILIVIAVIIILYFLYNNFLMPKKATVTFAPTNGNGNNNGGPTIIVDTAYQQCLAANRRLMEGDNCYNCVPTGSNQPVYQGIIVNGVCVQRPMMPEA